MDIYDFVPELFKKEIPKDTDFAESYFKRIDVDKFFNALSNYWNPWSLLNKIGGLEKLDVLLKDEDIFAAFDKRIAALVDTKMVLEGKDEGLVKFFTEQLTPFECQLKKDFFWSVYQGYGVEQIIYADNGEKKVVGFQREQFFRFEPLPDLMHVRLVMTNINELRNKVLPYGKWILTTNDGTYYKPTGEPLAEKLIQPWIFKCSSWDIWMDFAKRFANGFMHAKITDEKKVQETRTALEKAGKSAILVTDKNSDLTLISASRDSSMYVALDDKLVGKINRVILGESVTSSDSVNGTLGANVVHNDVRIEKTMADIKIVEQGLNQAIQMIAAVFEIKGELPVAKLQYDTGIKKDTADRDQVLSQTGVQFNKKYYVDTYGLKDDQFEVVEKSASPFGFRDEKKRTFLKPEDVKEFLGIKDFKKCAHVTDLASDIDANITRKANKSYNQKEDLVTLLSRLDEQPVDIEDVIAAINLAEDEKDLDQKLANLFDNKNNNFSEVLTQGLYNAAAKGALMGNPKTIKKEDK